MKEIAHNIAALIQRERRSSEARELAESLTGPAQDIVLTYLAEQVDGDPVLYVHDSGDVILWPSEDAAEDDDGRNALERWSVSPEAAEALAELDNS